MEPGLREAKKEIAKLVLRRVDVHEYTRVLRPLSTMSLHFKVSPGHFLTVVKSGGKIIATEDYFTGPVQKTDFRVLRNLPPTLKDQTNARSTKPWV